MHYDFNQFSLDPDNYRLKKDGHILQVEPQVFDLIYYLISNSGRLISRNELLDKLWVGKVVSDTTLSGHIKSARKILGDDGHKQLIIKTVHGRGYEFVAKVNASSDVPTLTPDSQLSRLSYQGPLIAILPFQNINSDLEHNFFAEGISEDITTELSRFSGIQVVASQSSYQIQHAHFPDVEMSEKRNIQYLVEGSVRRSNQRFRINVQLIDMSNGHHLWAEKYDRPANDIFQVQDEITAMIVSTVSGQIQKVEMNRATARSTKNLRAYDHLLRGLSFQKNGYTNQDDFLLARQEFSKAIELDPTFARARAWLICSTANMWEQLTTQKIQDALTQAKFALSLDASESEIHRILGAIYLWVRDYQLSGFHYREARRLSPNDAHIAVKMARYLAFTDQLDNALELVQRAMFLNPLHPGWYWQELGVVYYAMGEFDLAVNIFNRNWELGAYDLAFIAACHVANDDIDNAKICCQRALTKSPKSSVRLFTQFSRYQ